MATPTAIVRSTLASFIDGVLGAAPKLLSGLLFLLLASLGITLVRRLLRTSLSRVYPSDQQLIVDFVVIVVTVFLWFGTALVVLDIVGMGEIAASLGTATGFIALGVSYALSDMIEDTVAGIYLLKDPDFNIGDRVSAASTTGTVTAIGLRKSRFELDDGDVVVVANRDVEAKWTKQTGAGEQS